MQRLVGVAPALALVVLCAGCGGPDGRVTASSTSATPEAPPVVAGATTSPGNVGSARPTAPASTPAAPSTTGAAPTRGLLSTQASWDSAHRPVDPAVCTRYAGDQLDGWQAYRLSEGRTACWSAAPAWQNRPISVTVVFDPPAIASEALAVAERLMPADQEPGSVRRGVNPPYAPSAGGCASWSYTSEGLRRAVVAIDRTWRAPEYAHIILYSGGRTSEGADSAFEPGSVRLADLSLGDHDESTDGAAQVIC